MSHPTDPSQQPIDDFLDGDDEPDDGDGPRWLAGAVKMVEDIGIAMPPIPLIWQDRLRELSFGSLYATDPDLGRLRGRGSLEEALANTGKWPNPGLAFGAVMANGTVHWFYTLIGSRSLLLLSFRLWFRSESEANDSRNRVSAAHHVLELYLGDEVRYHRAADPYPLEGFDRRDVTIVTNETGLRQDLKGVWTETDGLGPLRAVASAFFDAEDGARQDNDDVVFFRV